MALFGRTETAAEPAQKAEKKVEEVKGKVEEAKREMKARKEAKKPKVLAKGYSTLDMEHKAILEPSTFTGAIVDVTKEVSNSFVASHVLQMGNAVNYTFGARYVKRHFSVGSTVSSNGVAQLDGIAGIPEAMVKGSVTVIPQIQRGMYQPIGGPMLSCTMEADLASKVGAFSGKVSSSPNGLMCSASGAVTNTFKTKVGGKEHKFTVMGGCEYCRVQEQKVMNLFSSGVRLTHHSEQPTEILVTGNNLGVVTSSVMKTILIAPSKDLKSLAAGNGLTTLSPCCELQVNTKNRKSCITAGLKAQKFDKDGELLKRCTVSIDTNGHCACIGSARTGHKRLDQMQISGSLEGNLRNGQWLTGIGVSW